MAARQTTTVMFDTLRNETLGLSDYGMMRLIDYARFLKYTKSNDRTDSRMSNISLLEEIKETQKKDEEDYVSDRVIDNALKLVFNLEHQPELFKTRENSINMQFEANDGSYLEFEVFEDRITCMIVPQRNYDEAVYPQVSLDNIGEINAIVRGFYGKYQ